MPRRKASSQAGPAGKRPKASTSSSQEGESSNDNIPVMINAQNDANFSLPAVDDGPQPLRSVCDSLGLHLSVATKEKIHKGEFVNLGALIMPPGSAPPSISFAIARQGDNIVLGPQQNAKPPAINSIEEWTSAFMVYMSVYLEVHGSRAIQMLKYMDIIRSAAQ